MLSFTALEASTSSCDVSEFCADTICNGMSYQPSLEGEQADAVEDMKVDIIDEEAPGHSIINYYVPRSGEMILADSLERYITEKGIELEERDAEGHTLLHTAAMRGLPLVVQRLLGKGANPNSRNNQGIRILCSTTVLLGKVNLCKESALCLQHERLRGRLIDCLSSLERSPLFDMSSQGT